MLAELLEHYCTLVSAENRRSVLSLPRKVETCVQLLMCAWSLSHV